MGSRPDPVDLVWEVTRTREPGAYLNALDFLDTLRYVVAQRPIDRYQSAFFRTKSDGSTRLIRPAKESLYYVQANIASWLNREILMRSADYCDFRGGVIPAVSRLRNAKMAWVGDLKRAFEYVTAEKLNYWLRMYERRLSPAACNVITDLLTFEGITPQGCVSTRPAYNLVIYQFDQIMARYCGANSFLYTRYVDNICISSLNSFEPSSVQDLITGFIHDAGFEINETKTRCYFAGEPIEFLGTVIKDGQLTLQKEKIIDFLGILEEALASHMPKLYKPEINGIFVWAYRVCGDNLTKDESLKPLWESFQLYYKKVGRPPKSYIKLVSPRML
jgi:hypothetical protein